MFLMPYDDMKYRKYEQCRVVEVIDGDTLKMNIDQGLNSHQYEDLRLIDCYAPESYEPGGPQAKEFLEAFVACYTEFLVFTFKNRNRKEKRTFTRYVADVYFAPGQSLSAVMVNKGHATATEKKP
jgi:endonuclease YncB( thermonuclease family)